MAPGDNIAHTFSCNCSPVLHIFLIVHQVSSQLAIQKWKTVTTFGYINTTPIGHKSFKCCLPTVESWRSSRDWNEKTFTCYKSLSDAEELYSRFFITCHIWDKHYQPSHTKTYMTRLQCSLKRMHSGNSMIQENPYIYKQACLVLALVHDYCR